MARNTNGKVRVYSLGGLHLGNVSAKEANRMLFTKHARIRNHSAKYLTAITALFARVGDRVPGGSLQTTYKQEISTGHVISMKRAVGSRKDHRYVEYDPDISVKDLVAGRYVSAATITKRAEDEYWRRWSQSKTTA